MSDDELLERAKRQAGWYGRLPEAYSSDPPVIPHTAYTKNEPEKGVGAPRLVSPAYYAIGSFFATPLVFLLCIFAGVVFLVAWPLVPFFSFFERREELANDQADR